MTGAISRREFITALAAAGGFPEAKAIGEAVAPAAGGTHDANLVAFIQQPAKGEKWLR